MFIIGKFVTSMKNNLPEITFKKNLKINLFFLNPFPRLGVFFYMRNVI